MMAWAMFFRTIHMNGAHRAPKSKVGFSANAGPLPQEYPQDFIDYAVSKGAAEQVPSPTRSDARAIKRKSKGLKP